MSLAMGCVGPPAKAAIAKQVKLDFAANPNHDHANGKGKLRKAKPPLGPRVDLSPRLELRLSVQCDAVQEQGAEMDWWLSVMR